MTGARRLPPGTAPVWTVLTLTLGGRVVRFAQAALTIDSSALGTLEVYGLLRECRLSESAVLGSQTSSASISFEVLWPERLADAVGALRGLPAMVGEVARWREGSAWEQRRVVLDGVIRSPTYGDETEPLAGTIEADVDDRSMIQEADAKISAATWNQARYSDADEGRPYPILFGYPGRDPQDDSGWHTAWTLIYGDATAYWQVGVLGVGPIGASEVYINSEGDTTGALVPVRHRTDALGRTVAVVDYNLDELYQGAAHDIGDDLIPGITNPIAIFAGMASGGGLLGPDGKVIREAGDVLTWACARFRRRRIDRGRLAAAATQLRGYFIDGVVDADTTVSDWLNGALLPILPASMVRGGQGAYPVVWRFDATAADAVYHVDVDGGRASRTSIVTVNTDDIRNDLALRYGYSARTGRYLYTARMGIGSDERASVIMEGHSGDRVRIRARQVGAAGAGIVISYVDAAGVVTITEDVEAKTIVITGNNGVCTAWSIVTVMASSVLCEAEVYQGTGDHYFQAGEENQERDYTTALRRTAGQVGSSACAASQVLLRRVDADGTVVDDGVRSWEGETKLIGDQATAYRVLQWMVDAYAWPERSVDVMVPEAGAEHVERGSVVTIADASVGFVSTVALVTDVEPGDTGWLGLRLRPLRGT